MTCDWIAAIMRREKSCRSPQTSREGLVMSVIGSQGWGHESSLWLCFKTIFFQGAVVVPLFRTLRRLGCMTDFATLAGAKSHAYRPVRAAAPIVRRLRAQGSRARHNLWCRFISEQPWFGCGPNVAWRRRSQRQSAHRAESETAAHVRAARMTH
jgi:hypothetical protein